MRRSGFHESVRDFKRFLLEASLAEHGGNQLLRLIKQFKVRAQPGRIGGNKRRK